MTTHLRRLAMNEDNTRCQSCKIVVEGHMLGHAVVVHLGKVVGVWTSMTYPMCPECFLHSTEQERLECHRKFWLSTDPGPQDLVEWVEIERLVREGERVAIPQRGIVKGNNER